MLVFCPGFFFKPCIFSHISLLIWLKAAVRHCVTNKNYFLHARKILLDNYTTSVCKNAGIQTKFRPLENVEHVLLSKQNRKSSLAVPVLTHPGRGSHICHRCQSSYWMRQMFFVLFSGLWGVLLLSLRPTITVGNWLELILWRSVRGCYIASWVQYCSNSEKGLAEKFVPNDAKFHHH